MKYGTVDTRYSYSGEKFTISNFFIILESSRCSEDFQQFFTMIHDIVKIENFTLSSNHCIATLLIVIFLSTIQD